MRRDRAYAARLAIIQVEAQHVAAASGQGHPALLRHSDTHYSLARGVRPVLDGGMELDLNLDDDLHMRALVAGDAALLAEATSGESAPSLWGPRPAGPYSLHDGQVALSAWDPAAGGQFSAGILHGPQLVGAVGLMPEHPGSIELAYWIRPERRGRGIASRAVRAMTLWAHPNLAAPRIWLEIRSGNQPSLRVAQRSGYHFEQRLPQHCRDWSCEDAGQDSRHDCLIWAHESEQAAAVG